MDYKKHQRFIWIPANHHDGRQHVTVVDLRDRGRSAKLSNGWVVDEDGVGEGTARQPGGCIVEPSPDEFSPFDNWYADVMTEAIANSIAPQDYKWSFENADTVWRDKFDAGMGIHAAINSVFKSH